MFTELSNAELMEVSGGWNPVKIIQGIGGCAAGAGLASVLGGSSVMTMGVGAALACGPVGWACVGAVALGAAAGGYLIGQGIIGN
ncbi:MAG TPA: bacteriocin [Defluviitaleaceae bacterium]|jgi:bacteriocin-like protein|nr:bacteriocin [Defluviitaleaceae bacterium]